MKIATVDVRRLDLELREPYTISYETIERATNFLLTVTADDGTTGYGCAAPAEDVTEESPTACADGLDAIAASQPGRALDAPLAVDLARRLADSPAAAAALDMARFDLRARAAGVAVCALLGSTPGSRSTSVTLGIGDAATTVAAALRHVQAGFRALKVKGGQDVAADLERLRRLRAAVGSAIDLRFDANQGYDEADAIRFVEGCGALRLSVLEQPVAARDRPGLARVTATARGLREAGGKQPVILADEAVLGPEDASALAVDGAVDGFVIKLMKTGGIDRALAVDAVAGAHGLRCMVSCMDELGIGIAAALHMTLAARSVRWVDLDGHLDLVDDPTAAAVRMHGGRLTPAAGIGLGHAPAR